MPLRRALRELLSMDRADLALRLLLVGLLLQPVGNPWMRPVFVLLAALGLLAPATLASAWLWGALAALAAVRTALVWPTSDNHAFLLAYWCLAAALASLARDRDGVLAWNGRALVAGTFVFATLWKAALAPEFLDGRFFAVTWIDDARFEAFTRVVAGLDADTYFALRDLVREHTDGVFVPWDEMPVIPERFLALARGVALGAVLLEGAVAVAFLAPSSWRLARARDPLLLLFCATTYALAPVASFGWLLLSMGVAQAPSDRPRLRAAYLAVFAWVLFATRWPWRRALSFG